MNRSERLEIRTIVLETLLEVAMAPGNGFVSANLLELVHNTLNGKTCRTTKSDPELRLLYSDFRSRAVKAEVEYWQNLTKDKIEPFCIYNKDQRKKFYSDKVSEKERDAWNQYVQDQADIYNRNPKLDSYDSYRTATSVDPDTKKVTGWAPPMRFEDWLKEYRECHT